MEELEEVTSDRDKFYHHVVTQHSGLGLLCCLLSAACCCLLLYSNLRLSVHNSVQISYKIVQEVYYVPTSNVYHHCSLLSSACKCSS